MKKNITKIIALLVAISCLFALAACGNATPTAKSESTPAEDATPTPAEDATPTPDATVEPTIEPTPTPVAIERRVDVPARTVATVEPTAIAQPAVGTNNLVNLRSLIPITTVQVIGKNWGHDQAGDEEGHKPLHLFADRGSFFRTYEAVGIPFTVSFAAQVQTKITCYSFVTTLDKDANGSNRPASWKLYGANLSNFSDGVLLDERTNANLPATDGAESEIFTIAAPAYYQFYRIEFTATAGNTGILQAKAMNIYGVDGDCVGGYQKLSADKTDISNYTILNGLLKEKLLLSDPSEQVSSTENNTKWYFDCDVTTKSHQIFQYSHGRWDPDPDRLELTFIFDKKTALEAYRFTYGSFWAIPTNWKIIGSNSSSFEEYEVLDVRENVAVPVYDYAESEVYECEKVGMYKYYKIVIYNTTYGNDENWMCPELAEMTLLQKNA